MIDQAFGNTLRNLRKNQGLSQEEFASRVDLHRTYISQLERGLKSPSLRNIERISQALGLTVTGFMEILERSYGK